MLGQPAFSQTQSPRDQENLLTEDTVKGGWQLSAIGAVDMTVTDNVYLTNTNEKTDFLVSPMAALEATYTGSRSFFDSRFEVAHDFYASASDLNGPRINALADGTFELDEAFSVRARAGTSLQASSYQSIISATDRTVGRNQIQVVTYGLSPTFRAPLNDDIMGEANYDVSGVAFVRAPSGGTDVAADNSVRQKAKASLSNENARAIVGWTVSGFYEQKDLSGSGRTSRRANGEAALQYRLSPTFALLGRGGYEWFDEPTLLTTELNGAYGLGGILYKPNSQTTLRLEAGYRYRKPNYEAELSYRRSERFTVSASFQQGVDTSQGLFEDIFGRLERDPSGIFVDPTLGTPIDPTISPFELSNQAFRYSRARLRFSGEFDRNFYNTSGYYERRSVLGFHGENWGADLTVGRDLTRRVTAWIEGRYVETTSPTLTAVPILDSKTTRVTAGVDYRIGPDLNGSLKYAHLKRTTQIVDYRENAAVLSLVYKF
jgi:uncharacterized protein (PEP-CTERM system associated)